MQSHYTLSMAPSFKTRFQPFGFPRGNSHTILQTQTARFCESKPRVPLNPKRRFLIPFQPFDHLLVFLIDKNAFATHNIIERRSKTMNNEPKEFENAARSAGTLFHLRTNPFGVRYAIANDPNGKFLAAHDSGSLGFDVYGNLYIDGKSCHAKAKALAAIVAEDARAQIAEAAANRAISENDSKNLIQKQAFRLKRAEDIASGKSAPQLSRAYLESKIECSLKEANEAESILEKASAFGVSDPAIVERFRERFMRCAIEASDAQRSLSAIDAHEDELIPETIPTLSNAAKESVPNQQ
jgi:hypothetical protein